MEDGVTKILVGAIFLISLYIIFSEKTHTKSYIANILMVIASSLLGVIPFLLILNSFITIGYPIPINANAGNYDMVVFFAITFGNFLYTTISIPIPIFTVLCVWFGVHLFYKNYRREMFIKLKGQFILSEISIIIISVFTALFVYKYIYGIHYFNVADYFANLLSQSEEDMAKNLVPTIGLFIVRESVLIGLFLAFSILFTVGINSLIPKK